MSAAVDAGWRDAALAAGVTLPELAWLRRGAAVQAGRRWSRLCAGYGLSLEDLEQEADVAVYRALRSYDRTRGVPVGAFVWRRVSWALAECVRHGNGPWSVLLAEVERPATPGPGQWPQVSPLEERIEAAMDVLPDELRSVVELSVLDGMRRADVCQALGIGQRRFYESRRRALAVLAVELRSVVER